MDDLADFFNTVINWPLAPLNFAMLQNVNMLMAIASTTLWYSEIRVANGTMCAYLFSPDEGSCYVFSTWNNCCKFLASYGVTFQSIIKPLHKYLLFWFLQTSTSRFVFIFEHYMGLVIYNHLCFFTWDRLQFKMKS